MQRPRPVRTSLTIVVVVVVVRPFRLSMAAALNYVR